MDVSIFTNGEYEYRCKVCKLGKTHPDLYNLVHDLHLEKNVSQAQVVKIINAKIDEMGLSAEIDKFNGVNLSAHMRRHVSVYDQTVNALQLAQHVNGLTATATGPAMEAISPNVSSTSVMLHRRVGTEIKDYERLEKLYEDTFSKMEMLSDYMDGVLGKAEKDEEGNIKFLPFDKDMMGAYTKLIAELRALINDLNKIRSGNKMVISVMQSLLQSLLQKLALALSDIHSDMMEKMVSEGIDNAKALKLSHEVKLKSAEAMSVCAKAVVEEITNLYKLKK